MDDLAYYFSNSENSFSTNENAHDTEKCIRRSNARNIPRPASIHFSQTTAEILPASLTDISEFNIFGLCENNLGVRRSHGHSTRIRNSKSTSYIPPLIPNKLPPEIEVGNIEYKRKLVNPTPNRFEHLVTQLKWRLNEGDGEAIYRLGVEDDGHVAGLTAFELASSLSTLERMASRLNATVHLLREKTVDALANTNSCQNNLPSDSVNQPRKAMELLVRQTPLSNQGKPSVCISVLGAVDVGKSTLIGVLTDGELDNARGRARLNLFRHLHEVQSGRTSCLSSEILGFDASGNVTNYKRTEGHLYRSSVDELIRSSSRLVTLLDSAGHSKYQRTTLAGLARAFPVGVLLVVSATAGLTAIGLDHAQLAYTLGLPMAVVISKIDQLCIDSDRNRQIKAVCRQISLRFGQLKQSIPGGPEKDMLTNPLFFPVSTVTGEGLEKLLQFLNNIGLYAQVGPSSHIHVPSPETTSNLTCTRSSIEENDDVCRNEELFTQTINDLICSAGAAYRSPFMCFWVSEVFTCVLGVPDPVLFGMVKSGRLISGHVAWLGPDQTGEFHLIQITSLHHNRQPHAIVYAGQTASVAVRFLVNLRPHTNATTELCESVTSSPAASAVATTQKCRSSDVHSDFVTSGNDENLPDSIVDTFLLPQDTLIPVALRRGMVLLSNASWSASYADMVQAGSTVPLKLPHKAGADQPVGVAWVVEVELLHRLSIFPGITASPIVIPPLPIIKQKVAFYAGCVAQPTVVIAEADLMHPSDKYLKIQLRFTRHPEYIEVGRQCIMSWASGAKAVGRVCKLLDLTPTTSLFESIHCWINTRGRLEAPTAPLPGSPDDMEDQDCTVTSSQREVDHQFSLILSRGPGWSQPVADPPDPEELQPESVADRPSIRKKEDNGSDSQKISVTSVRDRKSSFFTRASLQIPTSSSVTSEKVSPDDVGNRTDTNAAVGPSTNRRSSRWNRRRRRRKH